MNNPPISFLSDRELPLMIDYLPQHPTITVERYIKWYTLFLVTPDGKVRPFESDEYDDVPFDGTTWGDHMINPEYLLKVAKAKNLEIDSLSWELIVGRWTTEHESRYER